jgi:bifunctional UDP-N-acetylglucosamine pyrophosphorylase/glucosamine-1-phosphate N-acetyltransferase
MKGFDGNKTLLPLLSGPSPVEGSHPILRHILKNLPSGPKAIIVNHRKEDVIEATRSFGLTYCEQPVLNGTGGALLAARMFIEDSDQDRLLITMGDVPFVRTSTYLDLIRGLRDNSLVVLGFRPADKRQYGVLEIDGTSVTRILEWKYWRITSMERQRQLQICNSGIYAARVGDLSRYLRILEKRPHRVKKERDGIMVQVEEYFITDLIELMHTDGLKVGYLLAENEDEVMGVDDLPSLVKAQEIFKGQFGIRNSEFGMGNQES